MTDYDLVLELEAPHGFLMAQEKKTAIAKIAPLDATKSYLIVSDGEAFGIAQFEEPAQVKTKQFDTDEWQSQHRITQRERRQWWPDNDSFYIYRLKEWQPFEGIKLYEDNKVIDEPKLTSKQWQIVSAAKELPKQITLIDDAIGITDQKTFIFDKAINAQLAESALRAAYDLDNVVKEKVIDEYIPLYSLALVRNPRMRVSKKSLETAAKQEEGENMPFAIRQQEDEYCVVKINPDESEEVMACHESEEEAQAQLAALRINVEAEEGEGSADKPKKPKPRKKEVEIISEEPNFLQRLKLAAKHILDIVTLAETKEKQDILTSNYGIAQKKVNGKVWHFTYSTNAFRDRDGEIFSTKSLESYVAVNEENEDKGFFNLWHINAEDGNFNTDFAKKEWQGVIGRFLVEAGPYLDDEKGKAAKEFFSKFADGHPEIAPEGWGCSPEYKYLPEERATGTYETIWITRTSTLPRFDAANIWTETRQLLGGTKQMALSDKQKQAAIEIFGDDFVSRVTQEAESKTAELEEAGIAHKAQDTEQAEPQTQTINMEDLAAEVGKQFSANLAPMAEVIESLLTEVKELREWKNKQDKAQDIKDKNETPRYVFEWKRATEDDKTIVTEDDGLKDKKPTEIKAGSNDPWSQLFNK